MTTLSIELPPEVYERLRRIAGTRGTSAEDLAQVWLAEKTAAEPALPVLSRRAFMQLPLEERRRLMAEQAAAMADEDVHEDDPDRELWQGGDIIEQ
jgi:predicted transcriptional regulator